MNESDSERIAAIFEKNGMKPVFKMTEADLIIVNSCSVRQSAVDRIFGQIKNFLKIKKKNPNLKTILTGCVLPADKIKFRKYFDFIFDIKDLPEWPKILSKIAIRESIPDYLKIKPIYKSKFSAFVPISNGCDNFCTYCAVPYTRGRLTCRNHKQIIKEVKELIRKRYKEIWLLGQNVNNYHSPDNPEIDFAELLKMINNVPGDFWIRFTSPHPKDFSDKLIKAMAQCKKITPYLNLPAQSGDDEILRKMNRPYNIKQYKTLVAKIRKAFKQYRKGLEKEISLSTDIIVGFPSETEKQFQNSVKLFKDIKFDMAYIAEFSPRPNTAAAKMKDNVSKKEKEKRKKILNDILRESAINNNQKYINKEVDILVEEKTKGSLFGKTRSSKTVRLDGPEKLIGKIVKVKIINVSPWGLNGVLI